jgi:hypothetical protein
MPGDPALTDASAAETKARQFVTQSATRKAVLTPLVKEPASASAIATEQAIATAGAKSVVETLRDRGLVELLVTDEVHAFGLTPKRAGAVRSGTQGDDLTHAELDRRTL